MSLSDRINDTNAAPWVIEEIKRMEAECDALKREVSNRKGACCVLEQGYKRISEENEALAAHVERLNGILFDTYAAIEDGDYNALPYDEYRDAYNEAPTTSLDRLKAQRQADTMTEANEKLADCVAISINGLLWYRDQYPEVWTEEDEETVQHLEQTLEENDE